MQKKLGRMIWTAAEVGLTVPICAFVILVGCSDMDENLKDLKKVCRLNARVIVHDETLWRVYTASGERNYAKRTAQFSETGPRNILEYVEGFDQRYGADMVINRNVEVNVKPARNDIFVMKDGKIVAQLVDFLAQFGPDTGASYVSCLSVCPECYNREEKINA